MKLQRLSRALEERQDPFQDQPQAYSSPQRKTLIIAVVFASFLFFLIIAYIILRYIRQSHPLAPKFFPEKWKKKWATWQPGIYIAASSASPTSDATTAARRERERRERRERRRREREQQQASGVNRVESVRSIMTLPEYRAVPLPDRERTIGREGERGGIDVVVEAPETAEEEEARREDHMRALYEIRLARQLERAAERESAQNGGRSGNASRPAAGSRNRGNGSATSLAATLAAVQERERRLSEVSYAEIGVARPDGSRVRASSDVSDRDSLPLLDAGAPMGMQGSIRSGRSSHIRTSSALSLTSTLGTPERRRSDEIFSMGSAHPSQDNRDGSYDNVPLDRPPGYAGEPDWGAPPEYPGIVEDGPGDLGVPVLRIETASPDPYRPPRQARP
ncbi:hypothetical protein L873DRAFT_1831111 [Choiromyces venosus 120613-1]|uniref:Uncharacterized protein n=1 Tax=Choiromyces venosus 120613-1 TaxID=1336337 RepID=A0A3N4J366_9PEZI|nr:hypothetical protein L873DRAFT_1831111 [Choiromyces venosus 120613-1]